MGAHITTRNTFVTARLQIFSVQKFPRNQFQWQQTAARKYKLANLHYTALRIQWQARFLNTVLRTKSKLRSHLLNGDDLPTVESDAEILAQILDPMAGEIVLEAVPAASNDGQKQKIAAYIWAQLADEHDATAAANPNELYCELWRDALYTGAAVSLSWTKATDNGQTLITWPEAWGTLRVVLACANKDSYRLVYGRPTELFEDAAGTSLTVPHDGKRKFLGALVFGKKREFYLVTENTIPVARLELHRAQRADAFYGPLCTAVAAMQEDLAADWEAERFRTLGKTRRETRRVIRRVTSHELRFDDDGVLIQRVGRMWCSCIPEALQLQALKASHDEHHGGTSATIERLCLEGLHWHTLAADAEEFCNTRCLICAVERANANTDSHFYQESTRRFGEQFFIDHHGPYSETKRHNKYPFTSTLR